MTALAEAPETFATETAAAVLMGIFQPGTTDWDTARSGLCITATEIAAVLGLSPWTSRFTLWHKKTGLASPEFVDNPAIEWGRRLEDAVAQKLADNHPELHLTKTGTWQNNARPWQRATPDRLGIDRIAEVKTSPFGDEWGPDGSDEVPVYYRAQVIWQQDTLGLYERAPIAVLIGGHDYRELYVDYDPADAALMREAAQTFLHDVRHEVRPSIDTSDSTYQTIRLQPEGREDIDVEISGELAARYENAQDAVKAAADELTGAKSEVLDAIGNNFRAIHNGRRIAYRTVKADGTTRALQPARKGNTA